MTDNTVNFGTGTDERTGYNFQFQPVYSIPFDTFNFIPRGVVPIVGAPGGADFPNLGPPQPPGPDVKWGLSDIIVQTFFNPKSASDWKWGAGAQFSFKSRTSEGVAGLGGPAYSGQRSGKRAARSSEHSVSRQSTVCTSWFPSFVRSARLVIHNLYSCALKGVNC